MRFRQGFTTEGDDPREEIIIRKRDLIGEIVSAFFDLTIRTTWIADEALPILLAVAAFLPALLGWGATVSISVG